MELGVSLSYRSHDPLSHFNEDPRSKGEGVPININLKLGRPKKKFPVHRMSKKEKNKLEFDSIPHPPDCVSFEHSLSFDVMAGIKFTKHEKIVSQQ